MNGRLTLFLIIFQMKSFETLEKMSYLIYWYGAKEVENYYGFIAPKQFTKYETGVKKKFHEIPAKIQKKLDGNKKLSKTEEDTVDGIRDMQEDLEKEAGERKRGVFDFPEGYQMISVGDLEAYDEEDDDDEGSELVGDEQVQEKAKKKPSRTKKAAKRKLEDTDDENGPAVKKSKKTEKGSGKRIEPETETQLKDSSAVDRKPAPAGVADEIDFIGDADEDESEDDHKDDDFHAEDVPSEDEVDEDYDEGSKARNKSSSDKKAKDKKDKAKPKKEAPVKKKVEVKHRKPSQMDKQNLRRRLRDQYRRSEDHFGSSLSDWETALKNKDAETARTSLSKVSKGMARLTAIYVRESGITRLMKETKLLFKERGIDRTEYNDVWTRMKDTFKAEIEDLPTDFKKPERKKLEKSEAKAEVKREVVAEGKESQEIRTSASAAEVERKAPPESLKNLARVSKPVDVAIPRREGIVGSQKIDKTKLQATISSPVKPKPDRKKFLATLMGKTSKQLGPHDSTESQRRAATAATKQKQAPAWVAGPVSIEKPNDPYRSHAMNFLEQMAKHFPTGKVNVDSVARSLEAEIYAWASKDPKVSEDTWKPQYWMKMHCIVAAICGKRDPGTLMNLILDGDFAHPKEIVQLTDDVLADSLEGRPIHL